MAHFAKINDKGIVEDIIVISNTDMLTKDGRESEIVGQRFIKSLGIEGKWIQTSYSGGLVNGQDRGPYAGIGYSWDGSKFVAPPEELTE